MLSTYNLLTFPDVKLLKALSAPIINSDPDRQHSRAEQMYFTIAMRLRRMNKNYPNGSKSFNTIIITYFGLQISLSVNLGHDMIILSPV